MKAILSMSTEGIFANVVELRANHEEYAARHGYFYIHKTDLHWPDIAASFSKIHEITEALKSGFDPVLWVDIDVAFTDMTVDIGNLVDENHWMAGYRQRNIARDFVCCGLMVIRNCKTSVDVFSEVYKQVDDHFNDRREKVLAANPEGQTREQYMHDLWMRHPWEQDYVDAIQTLMGFEGVRKCNEREIGCFSRELWHDSIPWYPGCPTVHITGTPNWNRRQEVFVNHYMPFIKR